MSDRELNPKVDQKDAVYGILYKFPTNVKNRVKVILFDKDFQNSRTLMCDLHGEPLGVTYLKTAASLREARDAGLLNGENKDTVAVKPLPQVLRRQAVLTELADV